MAATLVDKYILGVGMLVFVVQMPSPARVMVARLIVPTIPNAIILFIFLPFQNFSPCIRRPE